MFFTFMGELEIERSEQKIRLHSPFIFKTQGDVTFFGCQLQNNLIFFANSSSSA